MESTHSTSKYPPGESVLYRELAVELGHMTRDQADAVRAEGSLAVQQIEQNQSPFCDSWEQWKPDPAWSLPQLVDDWRDLSMYQS